MRRDYFCSVAKETKFNEVKKCLDEKNQEFEKLQTEKEKLQTKLDHAEDTLKQKDLEIMKLQNAGQDLESDQKELV